MIPSWSHHPTKYNHKLYLVRSKKSISISLQKNRDPYDNTTKIGIFHDNRDPYSIMEKYHRLLFWEDENPPEMAGEIRHGVADPAEFVPGLRDAVATALLPRGPAELDQFRRSRCVGCHRLSQRVWGYMLGIYIYTVYIYMITNIVLNLPASEIYGLHVFFSYNNLRFLGCTWKEGNCPFFAN